MASPTELLATSLEALKLVQKEKDFVIIKSTDLTRSHLQRLVNNNFLRPIIKGWYMVTDPGTLPGDSTPWYASYWNFISRYSFDHYGKNWCLSAEQSLSIHSGSTTIPRQVIIRSSQASNNTLALLDPSSIFNLKAELPEQIVLDNRFHVQLYSLPEALINCSPVMYQNDSICMRTALAMIRDSSEILKLLVDKGLTTKAGRLAGAFRNNGREDIANEIINTMKRMGYDVREENPFVTIATLQHSPSPYVTRLKLMWDEMRVVVLQNFKQPKSALTNEDFLARMEAQYKLDAYNSLSIEGYRVTDELIERVKSGQWKPDSTDSEQRNALAARGYWQAFQKVKQSVTDIYGGNAIGTIVERDLPLWYQEMFMPCVTAGIIKPSDIVGYRRHQVYIRQSLHTPLPPEALPDAMSTLFDLLKAEPEAPVRAILGHFMFTFIHPYMDGNGRLGRFLMNTMLASGGYDWIIIPVEKREKYLNALEKASVEADIEAFVKFIGSNSIADQ